MEARRIRIEYDFSVTSRSTSIIDRIDTKTRNLNKNTTITRNSFQNLSRQVNTTATSLGRASGAVDRFSRSSITATSRLRSFSNAMHELSRNAGFAFRNLFSWRTLFLGFATGNLIGAAKRALIDYNVEMDNFRQGISMSLNQMTDWEKAFGGVSDKQERWNKSMIGSYAIMSNLRKYAAASIGSVKEYSEAFQLINAQVMAVGGTAGDSVEIAKRLVPLTKASGRDIMTGSMDVNQILRGDPNLRNINLPAFRDPRVIELVKQIRGNPKKGIEGKPMEGLRALIEIMKESDAGIRQYGKTYQAQMETMTDNFQVFAGKVGEPIFNRITKEMTEFNKDFASTEAALARSGEAFGKYLVDAFDKGRSGLMKFYESLKLVGASILSITQAMIALRVAGFAAGAASILGGQSRKHIAFPGMPNIRTFNKPMSLPPISGALGGVGYVHPAAAANGLVSGANATSSVASNVKQIGAFRSTLGTTMLATIGLGVAIAATTDRAKALSKEHGYLGKMARETTGVISGLSKVFTSLADISISVIGSIASLGRAAAKIAASMFGGVISHNRTFISRKDISNIADPQAALVEQMNNQSKSISEYERRYIELYGNDVWGIVKAKSSAKSVLDSVSSSNIVEQKINAGDLEGAYKEASKLTASKRSSLLQQMGGSGSSLLKTQGFSKEQVDWFPMFPEAQAAMIAEGILSPDRVNQTNKIVASAIAKRQAELDARLSNEEERIAREFIGRQKEAKPPNFDFSGSTIIMNQDFRNSDPDRVFIKFSEDIGLISANQVQSRLSPIVR